MNNLSPCRTIHPGPRSEVKRSVPPQLSSVVPASARSAEARSTERIRVGPSTGAAISELAVDDHRRDGANPVTLRPLGDVRLLHVVNLDLARVAREALHQVHRVITRR